MADASRGPGSFLPKLLLLGVLWGATFPVSRLGVEAGANPFLLVTIAFAIAAVVSVPVAVARRSPFPSRRSLVESAGVGALLIGGINLPLFWGVQYATGGVASIVYATAPMVSLGFVVLLGTGERVGHRGGFALVLGLAGVTVLALASGGAAITNPWGLAAFGLGAVCQGAGAVTLGRLRPQGEGAWGMTFQFVGGGAVSLAVLAAIAPHLALPWGAPVLVSVVYVGVASMVVGYALFFDLIRRHGAVGANQVTFLNPVVALVLGVSAFAEPFAIEEAGGLALILLALALLHVPGRRSGQPEVPPGSPSGPRGTATGEAPPGPAGPSGSSRPH